MRFAGWRMIRVEEVEALRAEASKWQARYKQAQTWADDLTKERNHWQARAEALKQKLAGPTVAELQASAAVEAAPPRRLKGEAHLRGRPSEAFRKAWDLYPQKGRTRSSMGEAFRQWPAAVKEVGSEEQLIAAVGRYAQSPEANKEDGEYVPGFHRWLKNNRATHYRGAPK